MEQLIGNPLLLVGICGVAGCILFGIVSVVVLRAKRRQIEAAILEEYGETSVPADV